MNFKYDVGREVAFSPQFEKFYKSRGWTIRRVNDVGLQNKGVDGYLDHENTVIAFDEKAQFDYCNKSIPTLAFEASYEKNGKRYQGWLFDKTKITDCYMYVSGIRTASGRSKYFPDDEVLGFECFMINRHELLLDLEKFGITQDFCNEKYELQRVATQINRIELFNDFKIIFSPGFAERPQNLVINKRFFLQAKNVCKKYLVTNNETN